MNRTGYITENIERTKYEQHKENISIYILYTLTQNNFHRSIYKHELYLICWSFNGYLAAAHIDERGSYTYRKCVYFFLAHILAEKMRLIFPVRRNVFSILYSIVLCYIYIRLWLVCVYLVNVNVLRKRSDNRTHNTPNHCNLRVKILGVLSVFYVYVCICN